MSTDRWPLNHLCSHYHHLVSSCLWRLSMNSSQAVLEAQPKFWLDSRSTQLRRAPKSLQVQFHPFLSRAHHLTMREPLPQRACLFVPFSLCSSLDFLICLKERAHGYPDTDDAEGGYSGTLQRFASHSPFNPTVTSLTRLSLSPPVTSHKQGWSVPF
jgi:hypothetical protein